MNRVDRLLHRIQEHKLIAFSIVAFIVIVALGNLTSSVDTMMRFYGDHFETEDTAEDHLKPSKGVSEKNLVSTSLERDPISENTRSPLVEAPQTTASSTPPNISKLIAEQPGNNESTPEATKKAELLHSPTANCPSKSSMELGVEVAKNEPFPTARDKLNMDIVTGSLCAPFLDVAVGAARGISFSPSRDIAFTEIVKRAVTVEEYELAKSVLPEISFGPTRGKATAIILTALNEI